MSGLHVQKQIHCKLGYILVWGNDRWASICVRKMVAFLSNQLLLRLKTKWFQNYTQLLEIYWRYACSFVLKMIIVLKKLWIF